MSGGRINEADVEKLSVIARVDQVVHTARIYVCPGEFFLIDRAARPSTR
jgi:hypothetical protein